MGKKLNKKYKITNKILLVVLILSVLSLPGCKSSTNLEEVTFVLDWVPNTNHTGVFVAQELGYFEDEGIKVNIQQPPEDGAITLVASGKAQFGVDFQASLAAAWLENEDLPVVTVATILQHNTSGIISKKSNPVNRPKNLENKRYVGYSGALERKILEYIVREDGGDFSKINIVSNLSVDAANALNSNIDAIWAYYGWEGIACKEKGIDINFLMLREINEIFDHYTPLIIANNNYLYKHEDTSKKFMKALSKGYEYAAENPEKSAEIMLRKFPELDQDILFKSQDWVSKEYIDNNNKWGYIDKSRWNQFYKWLYCNKIINKEFQDGYGFTNDYLP